MPTPGLLHLEQQIIEVDQKISRVETKVTTTDEKVTTTYEKMSQMLTLLVGNVLDKNDGGTLGRIDQMEKDIAKNKEDLAKMKAFQSKVIWIVMGMSVGAGFSLNRIIEMIKNIP